MPTNTTQNTHTRRNSPTFLTDWGCHSRNHDHSACTACATNQELQSLVIYRNDRNTPTIKSISWTTISTSGIRIETGNLVTSCHFGGLNRNAIKMWKQAANLKPYTVSALLASPGPKVCWMYNFPDTGIVSNFNSNKVYLNLQLTPATFKLLQVATRAQQNQVHAKSRNWKLCHL
jgi:hypothetical protein